MDGKRISIYLPDGHLLAVQTAAASEDRSISSVIQECIAQVYNCTPEYVRVQGRTYRLVSDDAPTG